MEFKITPGPLTLLWPEIGKLLTQGYSLIPVRETSTADWPAKSPFTGWKEFQLRRATEKELWNMMEKFNTTHVAMLCGAISGNIEVIDVDNKYKSGIDATLFNTIKEIFPSIWSRLRIHKSPSGGYHILYKIEGNSVPGNKKLASRHATEAEIAIKPKDKAKSFLETRGEGGYVLVPPSGGYEIWKATDELPTITWEDRCSLIALCESYNEVVKEEPKSEKHKEAPSDKEGYYEVNPFADFNGRPDAETVLLKYGWTEYSRNNKFVWFTRPGTVRGGIHAAFLRDSRLYYFFTTNSEFEIERCYQPATVFSTLEHNGDKKKTYTDLVQHGYGVIKPEREIQIANRAAMAGQPLPANISPMANQAYQEARLKADRLYPYGIFWEPGSDPNSFSIDREKLYRVAAGLGFRYDNVIQDVLRITDKNFIDISSEREFFDVLKDYIKENNDDIFNAYEAFLQKSGKFSYSRIKLIEDDQILKDTRTDNYKFYNDVFVHTTANGNSVHDYSELGDRLIWRNSKHERNFSLGYGGLYVDFLNKAVEYENRLDYVERIIGFLAHNYKDTSTGFLPIFTEICENPLNGGGAGKNLFCDLLKHTVTLMSHGGVQIKFDSGGKLLQSWNGERIFVISDVNDNFPYIMMKELISGDGKLEKKYKNEAIIPVGRMPKFIVITNYSYEIKDGGMLRRMIPLEFTDFFTKTKGVDKYYGGFFPTIWSEEDWAGYNFVIHRSIQRWLACNLSMEADELTESGWRKQFEENFGKVISGFIKEYWEQWKKGEEIKNLEFKELLDRYCLDNGISPKYHPTSFRINQAFSVFAGHHGFYYLSNQKGGSGLLTYKFRQFLPMGTPF